MEVRHSSSEATIVFNDITPSLYVANRCDWTRAARSYQSPTHTKITFIQLTAYCQLLRNFPRFRLKSPMALCNRVTVITIAFSFWLLSSDWNRQFATFLFEK